MTQSAKYFGKAVWIVLMSVIAIVFAYPFVFGVLGSFNSATNFGHMGTLFPIPDQWTLTSYSIAFQFQGAFWPLIHSLLRSAWYTFVTALVAILMGFVMARYNFKGKRFVIGLIIVTQVVPSVLTLIPSFVLVSKIPFAGGNNWMGIGGHGLINNPLMLYLPFGWNTLLWVFLFMQSMKSLSPAFEEAAEIDGCSFPRMMVQVVVPLQLPIIAVIAINTALGSWNDWLTPFMYINDAQQSTLTAWLGTITASLQQYGGNNNYPEVFALGTIAIIPTFIIFAVFQKYIIQGIASAGVKG